MRKRVIPVLLLHKKGLVKSVGFEKYRYVGDPINAVRIFNEKEVDEISIIDIDATREGRAPFFETIRDIVSEAFMPVSYGGGVNSLEQVDTLMKNGVEKVILSSASHSRPELITAISRKYGSQSVVVCIDHRRNVWGRQRVYTHNGTRNTGKDPLVHALECEKLGAGELVLQSIDRDGTYGGYDLELISRVSGGVSLPLVALGGAGSRDDLRLAIQNGASAVAAGSLFVYQGRNKGVLINYPRPSELPDFH